MTDSSAAVSRARWAVAALFLVNGAVIGSWAAHIPLVEERLKISHSTLGLALFAMALGALCAMPLTGPMIARLGSAAVTRLATPLLLAAFPIALLAPGPAWLMLGLFFFGAANGVMDVAMNAHGVSVERKYGRPVMSSLHGMWSLGGLLGAGFAALLLPVVSPFVQALLTVSTGLAASVVALWLLLPATIDRGNVSTTIALPNKATLGIGALCFLSMTSEGAVLDWGALHLRSSLNATPGLAAMGFAAFSASMAISRFSGDWLRARAGAVMLVRGSAWLAAAGLIIALIVPWPLVAVGGFALVGLGLANLVPVFFGAAGRIPGQHPGAAIAALATIGYSGFVVGPPVIGFVADLTSLAFALGLIVLACVVIALAAGITEPATRRNGQREQP
jgi:MFS family permease